MRYFPVRNKEGSVPLVYEAEMKKRAGENAVEPTIRWAR